MSLLAILLGLVAVPAEQAGNGVWNDTPGDAGGAPDITQVSATTAGGTLSLTIRTASASPGKARSPSSCSTRFPVPATRTAPTSNSRCTACMT